MKAIKSIYGFATVITSPLEAFLRFDFGERYMNIIKAIFPPLLFWFGYLFLSPFYKEYIGVWIKVFFVLSPIVAGLHILHRLFYSTEGMKHSYSSGYSWLAIFLPDNLIFLKNYIEPIIMFVLGVILFLLSNTMYHETYGLGILLLFVSISMLIRGQIEYQMARNVYLDAQDEHIESKALKDFLMDKQNPEENISTGFTIPGKFNGDRKSISEIYAKHDPQLRRSKSKEPGRSMDITKDVTKQPAKSPQKDREQ